MVIKVGKTEAGRQARIVAVIGEDDGDLDDLKLSRSSGNGETYLGLRVVEVISHRA